MKTKLHLLVATAVACIGLVSSARALTITWDFLENGSNVNLGNVSTFVESGYSLTAYGFVLPGRPSPLWAKDSVEVGETGLGMYNDKGWSHEIDNSHFVQLDSVITPAGLGFNSMFLNSIQLNEDAGVYGSNVLGSLGTQLVVMAADGNVDLTAFLHKYRYIGVTAVGSYSKANVLIGSLSATSVPDGGTTAVLLGLGLIAVGFIARRFHA